MTPTWPTPPLHDPPHPYMTNPTPTWPTPPLHDPPHPHPTPPLVHFWVQRSLFSWAASLCLPFGRQLSNVSRYVHSEDPDILFILLNLMFVVRKWSVFFCKFYVGNDLCICAQIRSRFSPVNTVLHDIFVLQQYIRGAIYCDLNSTSPLQNTAYSKAGI